MDRQDALGIRRRLLKSAIKKRTKKHHRLVLERDRLEKRTSETLSSIYLCILRKSIDQNLKNGEKEFIKTQEKKLKNLTKNSILKRSIQLSDFFVDTFFSRAAGEFKISPYRKASCDIYFNRSS